MAKHPTDKTPILVVSIMWLTLGGLCAVVLTLAGAYLYLDPQVPSAETYRDVRLETPLRILARDGGLLAEFGERRVVPVSIDEVPAHFINALLDTEDKRFYEHSGIDYISLANDSFTLALSMVSSGEITAGASTITMQLARNISFSLERSFIRKFKEMLLALKIEKALSKNEILELYINMAPFGKRAYGAQAAAMTYYGKPLAELDLPQLAMLAGIPQRPADSNPINGPEAALRRRSVVLARMHAQGSISDEELQQANSAPITAQIFARQLDVASPYASEWVRQQAIEMVPDLYSGGYTIKTTVDSRLQAQAITALRAGLASYDEKHGYRGAEAVLEPEMLETVAELALELPDLPEELSAPFVTLLSQTPVYGGLEPVLVVQSEQEHAVALRASGELINLALEHALWARPYLNVNQRGPVPTSMVGIVQAGDIVRIKPVAAPQETEKAGEPQKLEEPAEPVPQQWQLTQLPKIEGALVSLDPDDGSVQAMVGGYDFYRNQFNHALQAARQPGSGFKPFVYSAALEAGVTPSDLFLDAPLVFDDANLETEYRPDNDNNQYNGPTRLRQALYRSVNLVSMRVLLKIGAGQVLDHATSFGFDSTGFPRNTQLAIGGGTMAVTPIEMARAYAVLANGGYLIEPRIIESIADADGNIIYRPNSPQVCPECEEAALIEREAALSGSILDDEVEPASLEDLLVIKGLEITDPIALASPDPLEPLPIIPAERVLDERNAFIMQSMLADVIKRGTGRAAIRLGRADLAGKTGTTNDAADTWFNGFSSHLVTTVWVGFSDHEPLGARAFGSNTPLPIWVDFMEVALEGKEEYIPIQPPGVLTLRIDPKTGEQAAPGQSDAIFEYFLSEYAPKAPPRANRNQPDPEEQIRAIDLF